MKNTTVALALLLSIFSLDSAQAAPKASKSNTIQETPIVTTRSAATSGSKRFGLGFTYETGLVAGRAATSVPALSGWLDLADAHSLGFHFGIGGTSGGFSFSTGGQYRYHFAGNTGAGMYLGGGLDLGTAAGTFFLNISPRIGINFTLPGLSQIGFTFSGGPAFYITPAFNFQMSGTPSGLFGLSVHYFL
jgi:hypothetical protein